MRATLSPRSGDDNAVIQQVDRHHQCGDHPCRGLHGVGDPADPTRALERLTSPTAAMSIVFSDVCMTAVRDGASIEALALDHWLRPVSPASTGSPTATAAWRLASYSNVFVMALPDGGCSASVEAGDPQALQDAAAALTTRHGVVIRGQTVVGDDNHRTAWCTGEA